MKDTVNWFDTDGQNIVKKKEAINCPNCGAPIESERCPYCGSLFIDFACMSANEPFFLKIKHGDQIVVMKVMLNNMSVESYHDSFYTNSIPRMLIPYISRDITIELSEVR